MVYEFQQVRGHGVVNEAGHRVILREAKTKIEGDDAMADDTSVDPAEPLARALRAASVA